MRSKHYFALDETENALDYLRHAERFIKETSADKLAWKWVTIALHGALYGFAVAACRAEDVIDVKNGRLISVLEAVKLCLKKPSHGLLPGGKPYRLTDIQWKTVKQLSKTYRDGFEHFKPQRSVIPGNELPLVAENVLDVIRLIVIEISLIDHKIQDEVEAVVERSKQDLNGL
jgi:hypothetical protein